MDKKGKGHGHKGKKHSGGGGGSKAKGSNKGGSSLSHSASSAKEPRQDWTCLEQFMLSYMVKTYGDKNWVEVSRNLIYHEERLTRPKEWYTDKRCKDEYKEVKKYYLSSKGIRFADELTEEFVHRAIALECKDEMLKEKFTKIEERKATIRRDLAELNSCDVGRVKQLSTNETFREYMRSDRGINMIKAVTVDQLRKFAAETGDEFPDSLVELLNRRQNLPELPAVSNQATTGGSDVATTSAEVPMTITPAGPVSTVLSDQAAVQPLPSGSVDTSTSANPVAMTSTQRIDKASLPSLTDNAYISISGGQVPTPIPKSELTTSMDLDLSAEDIEVLAKSDSAIPPECFMEGDNMTPTTDSPERTPFYYETTNTKPLLDSTAKQIDESKIEVATPSQDLTSKFSSTVTAANTSISFEIGSDRNEDESLPSSSFDESQISVVTLSSDTSQDETIVKPTQPLGEGIPEEIKSVTQEVEDIGIPENMTSFVQESKEEGEEHFSEALAGENVSTDEKLEGAKSQIMEFESGSSYSSFIPINPSPSKPSSPRKSPISSPIVTPVVSPIKPQIRSPLPPPLLTPIMSLIRTPTPLMIPSASPVRSPVGSPVVSPFVSPVKSPTTSTASTLSSPFTSPTKNPIAYASEINAPIANPISTPILSPTKITSQSPTTSSAPSVSSESIMSAPPKITAATASNASEYDFDISDVPPPLPLVKKPQRQYPGPMTRREERLKDPDTESDPELEIPTSKRTLTGARKISTPAPLFDTSSSSVSSSSSDDTSSKKTTDAPGRMKSPALGSFSSSQTPREREPPKRTYDLNSNRRSTRLSALPAAIESKSESKSEGDDRKKSAASLDPESASKSLSETGSIKVEKSGTEVVFAEELKDTKAAHVVSPNPGESGEILQSLRHREERTPSVSPRTVEPSIRSPRKMEEAAVKVVKTSRYEERAGPSHLRSKVGSSVKLEMTSPDITNVKACVEKDKRTRARTRQSAPTKVYEREKPVIEESESDGEQAPASKDDSEEALKTKKKRHRRSRLNFLRDEASLIYGDLEETPEAEGDAKRRTRGSARAKTGSTSGRDATPEPKASTAEESINVTGVPKGDATIKREPVTETPLASSTPLPMGSGNVEETRNDDKEREDTKRSLLRIHSRLMSMKGSSIFQKKRGDGPGESSVKRPMDLIEIKRKIENGTIKNMVDLERDVYLMCCNFTMCYEYNASEQNSLRGKSYVSAAMKYLEELRKEGEPLPLAGTSTVPGSGDFATPTISVKKKGSVRGRRLSLTDEPEPPTAASTETSDESHEDEKPQDSSTSGGSSGPKKKQPSAVLPEEKTEDDSMGKKLRVRGGRPQAREQSSKSRGRHSAI